MSMLMCLSFCVFYPSVSVFISVFVCLCLCLFSAANGDFSGRLITFNFSFDYLCRGGDRGWQVFWCYWEKKQVLWVCFKTCFVYDMVWLWVSGDWTAADLHVEPRKQQGSAPISRHGHRRALLLPGPCDRTDWPNLHSPVQTVSVLCPIVGRQHTNSAAAASSTASLAQEGTSQRHAHPLRHLTERGGGYPSPLKLLHEAHGSIFTRIHTYTRTCTFFFFQFKSVFAFFPFRWQTRAPQVTFLVIFIFISYFRLRLIFCLSS